MVVDDKGSTIGQRLGNALSANDNATDNEHAFAKSLRKLGNFEKIGIRGAANSLQNAFAGASSEDPYYVSPAYYALTGRRGLWSYTPDDESAILFCLHPNVHDVVLIFPPFVPPAQPETATQIMQKFLQIMKQNTTNMKFEIGRVPENEPIKEALLAVEGFDAQIVPEKVLDWAYPVPTIDLNAMRERKGGSYAKLRQALNSIETKFKTDKPDESRLQIREIDFNSADDVYTVSALADMWEKIVETKQNHPHRTGYNVEDNDYFGHLMRMGKISEFNLRGMFLVLDGEPQGFSIWEAPGGKSQTANVFASQVAVRSTNDNVSTPHFTTGLIHKTGREIRHTGGKYMCLGGSETESQYRYKDKFVPKTTFPLVTISLSMEANDKMGVPDQHALNIPPAHVPQFGEMDEHELPVNAQHQQSSGKTSMMMSGLLPFEEFRR